MRKLLILAVILTFGTISLYAQGELDAQQKIFFRNEKSFAILLNSDGIGLSYRGAKRIDYRNKRLFEIDAGTLKLVKEYKQASQYVQGSSYIFGKLNSTIFLRSGIGHQHELFTNADEVIEKKFDSSSASGQDIYSKAAFTKGLDETKVMPGLYAKAGFNFEYSKEDKIIHAIEFGGQVNAFPQKIPIMAGSDNKALFFSLFVSYRFGIVLDPLDPESNKLSNIFRRKKNN